MTTARFITFEGGEGSGKSTQIKLLAESFAKAGISHILTREPGGTKGAEQIRNLLVQGDADRWDAVSETLLFQAARVDHVNRLIRPSLAENKWVLCDRYVDSTIVYQGIAKKLGTEFIQSLHKLTLLNFAPDLIFLLDIMPEKGLARAGTRSGNETRFEQMDVSFHAALREGFLALAKASPERFVIIDASLAPDTIHRQLVATLKARYNLPL